MTERIPSASDVATVFQSLIGLVSREGGGKSTMYMYKSGLTFPQIIVLYALLWEGPQTISVLAKKLTLSLAATSQLVDRLVEGQFVAREEDADDRRVRRVRMRPRGKQFIERLNELRHDEVRAAFERVPPKLLPQLSGRLQQAVSAMQNRWPPGRAITSRRRKRHPETR